MERYGYRWSNPNHAVSTRERMRHNALHVYARRGQYQRAWNVINASLEPWEWGEERSVSLSATQLR